MNGFIFFGALSSLIIVIAVICYIFYGMGGWRTFKKAGFSGFLSVIPGINVIVLCKIAWGRYVWAVLYLIPVVNIFAGLLMACKLSRAFGHGFGYGIGLFFLPMIFYILLGFGPSRYRGPQPLWGKMIFE